MSAYDYVIVGGGTAGLVVACRLAEDPSVTVAVLEAGEHVAHRQDVQIPGFYTQNFGKPFDWAFFSTPQAGGNDRAVYLPRGKGVGGSSILNWMQLSRAAPEEYNALETLGSEGWHFTELVKYFKKSESFRYSKDEADRLGLKIDPSFHGTSGPIVNTLPRLHSDIYPFFVKACAQLGIPFNTDTTGGNNEGTSPSSCAVDPQLGTRISSASAYLEPNKGKGNLTIIAGAHATRVILKKNVSNVVTDGVEYIKNGEKLVVTANKEVIISAGSFMTPQLLELSGIGASGLLQKHNIPVAVDLPGVGQNLRCLQDHFAALYVCEQDATKAQSFDALNVPERGAVELEKFGATKDGLYSTVPLSYAYTPLKAFTTPASLAKIKRDALSLKLGDVSHMSLKSLRLQKDWLTDLKLQHLEIILVPTFLSPTSLTGPDSSKHYFTLSLNHLHPFGRGSVHIASADPLTRPAIDLGLLNNEIDMEILVESIKFARTLGASEALRDVIVAEVVPGPEVQTDEHIREYLRGSVSTSFHPVGTASMLSKEEGGVVDASLKVYGTDNLRVVDASILPLQLGAHTQATVYAIAEKAADIIKILVKE